MTATGPPASDFGGYLAPHAHASTGLELAPDGHAAAPLDPDLRGSVRNGDDLNDDAVT